MTGRRIVAAAALAAGMIATPAAAEPVRLTATGVVSSVAALQNQTPTTVPPGVIHVGDTYSLTAIFDPATATVASLYDADPTINIYNLPNTQVTVTIGSYSRTFTPSAMNATAQLWNNYTGGGGSPTDAQSFSFFNYNVQPTSSLPFDLGTGMQSESFTTDAFDFTATARTNDLISQLASPSAFASRTFDYGLLNSDTQEFVDVTGTTPLVTLSAVAAAPEPATWLMMIVGFGVVGAALRRRDQARHVGLVAARA